MRHGGGYQNFLIVCTDSAIPGQGCPGKARLSLDGECGPVALPVLSLSRQLENSISAAGAEQKLYAVQCFVKIY